MKIFTKIFASLAYFIIFIIISILAARHGYLDKHIQNLSQFYFKHKGLDAEIRDLHIAGGRLSIKKISIKFKSTESKNSVEAECNNITVELNFDNIINKQFVTANLDIGDFSIVKEDNKAILHSVVRGNYKINVLKNKIDAKTELNSIQIPGSPNIKGAGILNGFASYIYKDRIFGDNKIIRLNCNLSQESNLSLAWSLIDGKIKVSGKIEHIPIMLYKNIQEIIPDNKIIVFLNEYINAGHINYGEFNLDIKNDFSEQNILTKENLQGKFQITNLEYKYNPDFPALKNAEVDIIISGSEAKFLIHKSYSGGSILSNGIITLNWTGIDTSTLNFYATSTGSVKDLIDFIPIPAYKNMQNKGLDLKHFTGTANSIIKLEIPINPKINNSYNVSTTISGAAISMFKNHVVINDLKLKGLFTGDKLSFNGTGKINQLDSDINYEHNINNSDSVEKDEFLLQIKTKLKGQNNRIGLVNLISGNSILNIEYKGQKNGLETFVAKANLKDIEFYIDKVSIHKMQGASANLELNGIVDKNLKSNIEIKLLGENNLDILGNFKIGHNKYELSLSKIKHKDTDIKCNIISDQDNFNAKIFGEKIDLSEIDMIEFLQKQQEAVNVHLRLNIDSIKLKNNISFNDVKSQILCNKTQCFSGYLDSKIGDKFLKLVLNDSEGKEQWEITSNDAGKVFKALGLYKKIGNGTMFVTLNLKKNIVNLGQVIPVVDGTFVFRNFLTSDTPFLTKIVSFISLPGLINFITNNKDIHFSDMHGNFSYIDNVLTISNASASGSAFDFTMAGSIDTAKHKMRLRGLVTPSIYGINNLVKNMPILGSILSRGRRKGIIIAPYSMSQEY